VKYNKLFRILALAVILSLLMLAIPATPALAQTILLSPISGTVGTTVTVTGTGFTDYTTVYILFDYAFMVSASVTGGTFSTSFTVPSGATAGQAIVTVRTLPEPDQGSLIAQASFTVTARQISISAYSGYVGDTVTVSGTGFNANLPVTIYFDATSRGTVTANTTGAFSGFTFTVPESYRGTHMVKGTDASGNYATVDFTTLQKITVTPASGAVGDTVTINGTGFAASSSVTFYFDDVSVGTATYTNSNGSFTNNTFTIPSTSRGSHTIKAQDASGNYAIATFTVAHKITITPTSGVSGISVTVSGTGFGANRPITIKYNNNLVTTTPASITTDANGSFSASFTVLASIAGTYKVDATDGTNTASANFVSTTDATISQTTSEAAPGYVGMPLTITGTGFKPNATVTVTYTSDPVTLATVPTDANGNFSVKVTIPPSAGGSHAITVTDGYTTKQFTFVMESTAPAIPPPLLPMMGVKAKSKAQFDWEDVTKDVKGADERSTPVTYTLQIATDADFKTILLKKEGLTTSAYTLTDAEKLKSTKKEAPYYWRLRAVDAASNASDWTGAGTFYVGFIFPEIKGGLLYGLIGAGALLLFFLGFWVGRRGGGYEY
jgi:hypothetical protein